MMTNPIRIAEDNLQIVILKCPYTSYLSDQRTRSMFEKVICLKYKGYFSRHSRGVQPVDGTDFLADHTLICKKKDGELYPILGAKLLPYEVCDRNNIDFTVKSFLAKGGHKKHLSYLTSELNRSVKEEKRVCYHSSWTTDPDILQNKELNQILKEIFIGMSVSYCHSENISELYGLGVPKYRTEKFFYMWGYERVKFQGKELEDINFRVLNSISGVFMHLKNFSALALKYSKTYEELWNNCITIGISDAQAREKDRMAEAA